MQLLPRPSSKAISSMRDDRLDPTLPVILEYQSPSSAIINIPMPRIARGITLTISMVRSRAISCRLAWRMASLSGSSALVASSTIRSRGRGSRARDGEALPLPAREVAGPLLEQGVVGER